MIQLRVRALYVAAASVLAALRVGGAFDFATDTFVNIHIPKAGGSEFEAYLGLINSSVPCVARAPAGYAYGDRPHWRNYITVRQALGRGGVAPLPHCGVLGAKFNSDRPALYFCPRTRAHMTARTHAPAKPQGWAATWLMSRVSVGTGWFAGVHAGYERQRSVVQKIHGSNIGSGPMYRRPVNGAGTPGRIFYIAMVRQPVARVLSEHNHHYNGWPGSKTIGSTKLGKNALPRDSLCNGTSLLAALESNCEPPSQSNQGKTQHRTKAAGGGTINPSHASAANMLCTPPPPPARARAAQAQAHTHSLSLSHTHTLSLFLSLARSLALLLFRVCAALTCAHIDI